MSTKPSAPASWDTNGLNLIAPTSGHKTDGWATNEIPTSSEMNGWMREVSDWTQWLYDGDITFSTLAVTDLTVNGSITFTNSQTHFVFNTDQAPLDPLGSGTVSGIHTIYLEPTVDNAVIHSVADTGVPDGQKLVIYNDTTRPILVRQSSSSAGPNNSIFFSYPYIPTNSDVILTGAGAITLERTSSQWNVISTSGCRIAAPIIIPGASIVDTISAHAVLNSTGPARIGWTCNVSTDPFTVPVEGLLAGDRITSYSVLVDKASGGTGVWTTKLYSYDAATGPTETAETTGYTFNTAGAGLVGLGENSLDVLTAYTKQYYIILDPTTGCSGDSVYHAVVWVTRPI